MADLSQISTDQLVAMLGQHSAAQSSTPVPQPENGGILKNLAAGAEGALTSIPQFLGNVAERMVPGLREADQLSSAAGSLITKKPAPTIPQATSPHTVNAALGAIHPSLNPENVTANTFPERLARGVGAGLTGALIPGEEGYTVGQMLKNAAVGATSGAGAATGSEITPEGYKPLGAIAGAVLGPMGAVGAVNGIRAGVGAVKNAATGFTSAGPEQTVGKILAQAAGGVVPTTEETPLPSMKPSIGQATGNPGLLNLERVVERTPGEGPALAGESRIASNQAVMDAVQKIGDVNSPAAENMLDSLEKARETARQNTRTAWKQAGIDETAPLSISPLKQDIQEYIGGLTRSGKAAIPSNITDVFSDFGDTEPLREIQDWRSGLAKSLRDARMSGDDNGMRILGGIADRVDDFLDNGPTHRPDSGFAGTAADDALTEEDKARYDIARASTRGDKQIFRAPGSPVVTALSPKDFGTASESNTANLFIKPNTQAGAPEAFDAYMKALGHGNDEGGGYQAARDAFAQKFQNAITGQPDAQGNTTIKPAAVSKFLDQYDHVISSDLFTDDQRGLLERIGKAAQMTNRPNASASSGSATFQNLAGKNWVDALVGAGTKRVARAVGGTLGYATGGPVGAAAGAYSAPKLMETMLSANKEASMKLLTQALYDPELAKVLMTRATASSANKISLPLQARIYSTLLGKTANDNSARKVRP